MHTTESLPATKDIEMTPIDTCMKPRSVTATQIGSPRDRTSASIPIRLLELSGPAQKIEFGSLALAFQYGSRNEYATKDNSPYLTLSSQRHRSVRISDVQEMALRATRKLEWWGGKALISETGQSSVTKSRYPSQPFRDEL